jgi:transcriptional regulator with XRE-family HTH domain
MSSGPSQPKLNDAFGETLAMLRKERGWTQEFLSFESGLTRNYISLLELGKRSPTLHTISRIADALGIDEVQLLQLTVQAAVRPRKG